MKIYFENLFRGFMDFNQGNTQYEIKNDWISCKLVLFKNKSKVRF